MGSENEGFVSGMRAHIDPVTGRFIQEPAHPARTAQEPAPDREALEQVVSPLGGVDVRLDDRFMSHSVATIDATGHIHVDCEHGAGEKLASIRAASPAEHR